MEITTWVIIISSWLTIAEVGNCVYPRLEDDYDSEGFVCQWEESDFYYDKNEDDWILVPTDDNDNIIEEKVRRKYWERRLKQIKI